MAYWHLSCDWFLQNNWAFCEPGSNTETYMDDGGTKPSENRIAIHSSCSLVAYHLNKMTFLLGALGVIFCIVLALSGYFVPVIVGGFIGSFFGVAGFGGAVSGMIPGAILGAIIAVAIKKS